jgi:hypothetical protein
VIQKLARGNATRAKAHHRAEAVKSYERDVKQAERRAKETAKREQASVSIQSVFRARRARIEAKRLWLQAWAKGRETQNIRGVVVSKHSPEQWTRVEVVECTTRRKMKRKPLRQKRENRTVMFFSPSNTLATTDRHRRPLRPK